MKEHWTTIIVNVNLNNKAQARVQGSFITLKNFKISGDICKCQDMTPEHDYVKMDWLYQKTWKLARIHEVFYVNLSTEYVYYETKIRLEFMAMPVTR